MKYKDVKFCKLTKEHLNHAENIKTENTDI